MTPRQFLEASGWQHGAGGQYYFPNDGYPHLHLGTTGMGMETGNIGDNATRRNKQDAWAALRSKIRFVAISSGGAVPGRNFIDNGNPTYRVNNAASHAIAVAGDDERTATIVYELDYILHAYGYTAA